MNENERLNRLENEVAELKQMMAKLLESNQLSSDPQNSAPNVKQTIPAPPPPVRQAKQAAPVPALPPHSQKVKQAPPAPAFNLPEHMKTSEYWLNKIGIGLMLFAVVFLFKYSVDQGWLIPQIRVGLGLLLGLVFYGIGFKIYKKRMHFALVLLGGGTATFYITGFAAFQMFELVSHMTALIYMSIITAVTLLISVRQNEQVLSIIGIIGGLATPFLLYTGEGNMPGLMMYTSLISAGAVGIYFFKSWRSLLWLTVFGNWMIMVSSVGLINQKPENFIDSDYWGIQFGLIASLLFFWMVPLLREIMGVKKPDKFFYAPFDYLKKIVTPDLEESVKNHAYALTVSTPLIALGLSVVLWGNQATDNLWGYVYMGCAMLFGVTAYYINRWEKLKGLAYAHLMVGITLLTISFTFLFDNNTLLFTLAAEALALFLIGRKINLKGLKISSHIIFGLAAFWVLVASMFDESKGTPIINEDALTMLWVIGAILAVAYLSNSKTVKRVYLIAGFGLLASVLARELDGNILFVVLTTQAAVLHYLAYKIKDRIIVGAGHLFVASIGLWLVDRLLITRLMDFPITRFERPLLNLITLSDFVYMLTLFFIPLMFKNKEDKIIYRIWLHVIVLAVLLRDFQGLENGQGYVTIAWGIYAAILMILGLRKNHRTIRTVALATLFLVVVKLFLVDLKNIETIWRILLFFGFGGAFMFLSYYFKALWKRDDKQRPDSLSETKIE